MGSRPKAVVTEFETVSHVAAATAGFLVALVSTHVLRMRNEAKTEVEEQNRDHALQQRIGELETSLANMQTELDAERQRAVILEKARAATVTDVTHALSQKRDAEFALSEAQEEITRLKSNTIQQVPSDLTKRNCQVVRDHLLVKEGAEGEEGTTMDLLAKIMSTPLTAEAREMLKNWMDGSEAEKQTDDSDELSDADVEPDACKETCLSTSSLCSYQQCRNWRWRWRKKRNEEKIWRLN